MTRLGLYNSSEMVIQSALEEGDVDATDIHFLSGDSSTLTPNIADKTSGSVNHDYGKRRE